MKTNNLINLFRLYLLENKKNIFLFVGITFLLIWIFIVKVSSQPYQFGGTLFFGVLNIWIVLFMILQSKQSILKPINKNYLTLPVSSETKWMFLFILTSILVYIVVFITHFLALEIGNLYLKEYNVVFEPIRFEVITFKKLFQSILSVFSMQGLLVTGFLVFKRFPVLKSYIIYILTLIVFGVVLYYILGDNLISGVGNGSFRIDDKDITVSIIQSVLFWTLNYFLLKKRQLK